jgi:hypothetical protein
MKPSSRVKIRACRLNGALSRGPITGEGKLRSSRNGTIHGLYSKQVVLPNESPEDFEALVQAYIDALHPRNRFELELVREMAVARWRGQRIWTIEKRMMTETMPKILPIWAEIVPESANFDEDEEQTREINQTTDAFSTLAENNRHFLLLNSHEYRQKTIFLKALHRLLAARRGSPPPGESVFSISNPPDDFFMDIAK